MNAFHMRYRWLTLGVAVLVAGCAAPSVMGGPESNAPQAFNLQDVYRECNRLGCREPNRVVARYFSRIVKKTGTGCIVHVVPGHDRTPSYWDEYLRPLHRLLVGSRVRMYAYMPSGHGRAGRQAKAQRTLELVKGLYRQHGAARGAVSTRIIADPSAVVPPYREPYCRGRAILEIVEGARLVSPAASRLAEHVVPKDRAARTVLVVVETGNGG